MVDYYIMVSSIVIIIAGLFGGSAAYLMVRNKSEKVGLMVAGVLQEVAIGLNDVSDVMKDSLEAWSDEAVTAEEFKEIKRHMDAVMVDIQKVMISANELVKEFR